MELVEVDLETAFPGQSVKLVIDEDELVPDMMDLKQKFWARTMKIPGTPWTICGDSRSALRTAFYIKELDTMLDAGLQNFKHPAYIYITHTHGDHIGELPFTLIGGHIGTADVPTQIYVPERAVPYIREYIDKLFTTNGMYPQPPREEIDNYYLVHGLIPGETWRTERKNANLVIEVFECDHRIPTVSYGFSEIKDKLKPEYSMLEGREIAKLRKAGTQITAAITYKRFAYVCDTTIMVFDMNPSLIEYPVIMIECTFLDDNDGTAEDEDSKKHIYWPQLQPYVEKYPEKTFILFHFSKRYKGIEIRDFFQAVNLPNVIPWI